MYTYLAISSVKYARTTSRVKGLLAELYTAAGLADCRGLLEEMYVYDTYGQVTVHEWPPGDVNFDGFTNLTDMALVKSKNGDTEPVYDANLDGYVNLTDMALVKSWNGESTEELTSSGLNNPYFFTGRTTDTLHASSLLVSEDPNFRRIQDNRQRMYDPKHGRWLQRDPLGVRPDPPEGEIEAARQYVDGMSLYLYVYNNPARFLDPEGLIGPMLPVRLGCSCAICCRCGERHAAAEEVSLYAAWQCRKIALDAMSASARVFSNADQTNAFVHCYGQCVATVKLSSKTAKKCADIHEACVHSTAGDENRDQHNNALGRSFGSKSGVSAQTCYNDCYDAAVNGASGCDPPANEAQLEACGAPPPNPFWPSTCGPAYPPKKPKGS